MQDRLDKTAFSVLPLSELPHDKAYWLAKTPQERLEALEFMRQVIYGYNPMATRVQRTLTVVNLSSIDNQ